MTIRDADGSERVARVVPLWLAVLCALGSGAATALAVGVWVGGIGADVRAVASDVKELKTGMSDVRERVARIEGRRP